ncbi:MAG: class I adenylate-forming enzyme family protein [Lachnospiraceae bacterium]|nr:class I adenylate-forming enzyme family protein [Lachnospiraceae bacterium]
MRKELTGYPTKDKPWMKYYDEEFVNKPIPKTDIYSYMRRRTRYFGKLTAFSYLGKEIKYDEFFEHVDEAAKALLKLGVKPDDRIMYLMPNIPETAYLLYGGARIGAVADYIDPRPDSVDFTISAKKVLDTFKTEKAKYLVSLEQCYLAMLKPIENELKELGVEQIVLVSATSSLGISGKLNYLAESISFNGFKTTLRTLAKTQSMDKMVKEAKKNSPVELVDLYDLIASAKDVTIPEEIPYSEEKLAAIVHTSGTSSSKPKPIVVTHDNLNSLAHQITGANVILQEKDRALHILPYFAAFGLGTMVHTGLCSGANLIQIPEFDAKNFGKLIVKYKPQVLVSVPSWLLSMEKDPAIINADLSCLTLVIFGGDAMEAEDEARLNRFMKQRGARCVLTKGHGMSEICGTASYATRNYNYEASMGIPLPLTNYGIVDPNTKELIKFEEGQEYIEGELIVSSGAVTPGVLDGVEIVPSAYYDGERFIFTRDLAQMNRDGIMTFLTRSDRSITRFDGYKIKPYEVEDIIKGYPGIQYCILSPIFDESKYGNVSIANVVLEGGYVPDRQDCIELVKKLVQKQFVDNPDVSSRQIPAWFRFRKDMPLTVNAKVNYNILAKEPLTGDEIKVHIIETNIAVDSIEVY